MPRSGEREARHETGEPLAAMLGVIASRRPTGALPLAMDRRAFARSRSRPIDPPPASSVRLTSSTSQELRAVGLPSSSAVPLVAPTCPPLESLPLDPRAAFVLAQIDGRTSIQEILDLETMPRAAVFVALCQLARLGVIAFA